MSIKELKQNIENLFGKPGKVWINNLPNIIAQLTHHWSLTNIKEVKNMSYNFVATAVTSNNIHVVIKVSYNKQLIEDEIKALKYYSGSGCIKLIDYCPKYNSLLLSQAIPGNSLKSIYPQKFDMVVTAYAQVIKNLLSTKHTNPQNFIHIREWLKAIDRATAYAEIPSNLLNKAITLKEKLLATSEKDYVLHGDLHHDNILRHDHKWLAIDPKGIIGEIAFEAAAFDFINDNEIQKTQDIYIIFKSRLKTLSNELSIDSGRLTKWTFVRLVLSAAWFVEDNCDPSKPIKLAKALENFIL